MAGFPLGGLVKRGLAVGERAREQLQDKREWGFVAQVWVRVSVDGTFLRGNLVCGRDLG